MAYLTALEAAAMHAVREEIKKTLVAEQGKRDEHRESDESGLPAWMALEQQVVFAEVNQVRATGGLPPVEFAVIERIEQMACGHSDYTSKFCLYAAEVAFDLSPRP